MTKSQIPTKSQAPNPNIFGLIWKLEFGILLVIEIWNLGF